MEKYQRIGLKVEAIFDPDGTMRPCWIHCEGERYHVDRILGTGKYCPSQVRAVAPMEYRVIVNGRRRNLYYEADSNSWFSVKMYASDGE